MERQGQSRGYPDSARRVTPSRSMASISSSAKPASFRIATLSSPCRGAKRRRPPGDLEKTMGFPATAIRPSVGCSRYSRPMCRTSSRGRHPGSSRSCSRRLLPLPDLRRRSEIPTPSPRRSGWRRSGRTCAWKFARCPPLRVLTGHPRRSNGGLLGPKVGRRLAATAWSASTRPDPS